VPFQASEKSDANNTDRGFQGQILTNHHVAEPWWNNYDLKEMTDQGVEPTLVEMTALFSWKRGWHLGGH